MVAKAKARKGVPMTIAVDTKIDPFWMTFVTGGKEGYMDVFMTGYCGYWAFGARHDPYRGWLVYEAADDGPPAEKAVVEAARTWKKRSLSHLPLPERFHRWNEDLARKAWAEGVKRWGVGWYDDADGLSYDWVIQTALFGEAKYG